MTTHSIPRLLILAACLALAASAWSQGPLQPPGAPAATMKSLDQVEPRTPISALPTNITASGSYYLTGNLSGSTGIVISASFVSIDLMGFTLTGLPAGGGVAGEGGCAIEAEAFALPPPAHIRVSNGQVRGWEVAGINLGAAQHVRIDSLHAASNGFGIAVGAFSQIVDCRAVDSTMGSGMSAGDESIVRNCIADRNASHGFVVGSNGDLSGCLARNNGADAIRALGNGARIEGNTATGSNVGLAILGADNRIAGNFVSGNADNYNIAAGNRVDLLLSEIPETLDWPCSVRLEKTLVCTQADVHGITVAASDVTIDLSGHAIVGPGAGSRSGIYQDAAYRNLTVRNGLVANWQGIVRAGIEAHGHSTLIADVRAQTNNWGIATFSNSVIRGCAASRNQIGFLVGAGSDLHDSQALLNHDGIVARSGCILRDCSVADNTHIGLIAGDSCILNGCVAASNAFDGIMTGRSCTLIECTAIGNGSYGFDARDECVIRNCTARANTFCGISGGSGSLIVECTAFDNIGNGIQINDNGSVLRNCCGGNRNPYGHGAGIRVSGERNRVEDNHCTDNDLGINVAHTGNFIVRNTAGGNTTNWVVMAGNACLVVQAATGGAISGDSGGVSPGSTNPNANYTH